jgi:hypothetical protein
VRGHNEAVNRLDFWPSREAINVEYNEGDAISAPARRLDHPPAQDPWRRATPLCRQALAASALTLERAAA